MAYFKLGVLIEPESHPGHMAGGRARRALSPLMALTHSAQIAQPAKGVRIHIRGLVRGLSEV